MNDQPKVYVALSGGVDSSVSAYLLQKQGYDVTGVFMKNFDPALFGVQFAAACHWQEDQESARQLCTALAIPFKIWNFEKDYYLSVIDYFFREYKNGRTPNPDVMCNKTIKFGVFLRRALAEGADYVATGHYSQLSREIQNSKAVIRNKARMPASKIQNNYKLLRGADRSKDQSYFLWTLRPALLQYVLFPIGHLTKPQVRQIAADSSLATASRPDSQGICFVGEINIKEFLKTRLSERAGQVVTPDGMPVGEHKGVQFYTEGQRQGLGIGGGIPYYVAHKDAEKNVLTVAKGRYDQVLFSRELTAKQVNWLDNNVAWQLNCQAQIRYRQAAQECTVTKEGDALLVTFKESQRAITPGQSIVFYDHEQLLGGGVIE